MLRHLDQSGPWKIGASQMVAEHKADPSGLVFNVFPDLRDPLHIEIWEALRKQHRIGDGYGIICRYYGLYLVTVSEFFDHGRSSSFYSPKSKKILAAQEDVAFSHYRGERSATDDNIRRLVTNLLATRNYPTSIVDDYQQIPHSKFKQNNPQVSFADFLAAKGIIIRPTKILRVSTKSNFAGYDECSVFAYQPCGGIILRYDVTCHDGRIVSCEGYELVGGVGDCWFIM